MSLSSAVIDAMVAAGCSVEQLAAAVKASNAESEARIERRRELDATRKRRQRARVTQSHADNSGHDVTPSDAADPSSPEGSSPTPPSPKTLSSLTPSPPKGGSVPTEFLKFWAAFPNKVGQSAAKRAFDGARRRVDFETLMAGLARYVAKTDDRPWCNPATWLNQDRWTDEPAGHGKPNAEAPPSVDWLVRVKAFRDNDVWAVGWGPKPGEPGCRAQVAVDRDDPLVDLVRKAGVKFTISDNSGKAFLPADAVIDVRADGSTA